MIIIKKFNYDLETEEIETFQEFLENGRLFSKLNLDNVYERPINAYIYKKFQSEISKIDMIDGLDFAIRGFRNLMLEDRKNTYIKGFLIARANYMTNSLIRFIGTKGNNPYCNLSNYEREMYEAYFIIVNILNKYDGSKINDIYQNDPKIIKLLGYLHKWEHIPHLMSLIRKERIRNADILKQVIKLINYDNRLTYDQAYTQAIINLKKQRKTY